MIGGPIGALRVLAAIYIFFDANKRGFGFLSSALLSLAALYIPMVVIPLYFLFTFLPIKFSFKTGGAAPQGQPEPKLLRLSLCPKCGSENPAGADVCRECENNLTL
jgi:hypothetical protein